MHACRGDVGGINVKHQQSFVRDFHAGMWAVANAGAASLRTFRKICSGAPCCETLHTLTCWCIVCKTEPPSLVPLQALTVADGCRDAAAMLLDGSTCPLAELMASWGKTEHGERSFQTYCTCTRCVFGKYYLYTASFEQNCCSSARYQLPSKLDPRWCKQHCRIQPGQMQLSLKTDDGVRRKKHAVLWPWDILNYLYTNDKLGTWLYDPPERASFHIKDTSLGRWVKATGSAGFRDFQPAIEVI